MGFSLSVHELIDFAGGDTNFNEFCRTAASVVKRRWTNLTEEELTQMIAVEAIEGAPTLVKNLHKAGDPDTYLMGALVREGSRAASEATYAEAVSGVASGSEQDINWYEEVEFGTPTGLYSTDAVRSALTALDWTAQDDPLMMLVVENLPKLSETNREILIDRFVEGKTDVHSQYVTNAVDRLTKLVNSSPA